MYLFKTLNAQFHSDKKTLHSSMRASELARYWRATERDKSLLPKNNNDDEFYRPESSSFHGLSCEDFHKHLDSPDMGLFNEAKKSLSTKLGALSQEISLVSPKRRRILAEHDGELDFDRLYDLKPFNSTQRINSESFKKSVVINCAFAASGAIRHSEISKWGALCFALISILEDSGITCEVNIVKTNRNVGPSENKCISVYRVKDAGEYVSESELAKYFSGTFYRRALLCGIALCFLLNDKTNREYSLGSPESPDEPLTIDKNIITLGSDFSNHHINSETLRKAISQ